MAASLVAMVGRGSPAWAEGAGVAARALALRARLLLLGEEDARAFGAVLATVRATARTPGERGGRELATALVRAAEPPLAIAEAAVDVAELAALAAAAGKAAMRADTCTAGELARAAARSAVLLVETNLAAAERGGPCEGASELAEAARAIRRRLGAEP